VDVARLAGVSRATVSHILNDQVERFSAETVERVRLAAAELGYVRSAAGRALVMGRSDFVVLIVHQRTFMRIQDVIEVVSADVEELGFTVVLQFVTPRDKGAPPARLLHMIETLRPAGVVDMGGLADADKEIIERAGCPVLPQDMPFDFNSWIGLVQAHHLHARGYTRLAYGFMADLGEDPYGGNRAEAVIDYCRIEELEPPTQLLVPIEPAGAEQAVERLLALRGRPVGVACYNDQVAVALVFAARRLGLDVPRDVAVIGAEGAEIGQAVTPRLTTVSADVRAAVAHIRKTLAQTYGGPSARREEVPGPDDVFKILLGETT